MIRQTAMTLPNTVADKRNDQKHQKSVRPGMQHTKLVLPSQ
jgi:hypothetical protein